MGSTGKKAISIFFVAVIMFVGAGTAYRARSAAHALFDYKGFTNLKTEVEDSIQDKFLWRYGWINVNGLFYRMTGMTLVPGSGGDSYDVYKLSNGQIMYNLDRKDNMAKFAEKISKLRDQTEEQGKEFLYVQLPFKIKDDSYMPPGISSGGNLNADELVKELREKQVDVLDIREEIKKKDLDWDTLFFKTDHHWTPETGMWASGLIMDRLKAKSGIQFDASHYDYDSYEKKTYSNYMLGAVGRRVGAWYAGLDDIDIVYPKFDTDMSFYGESKEGIDEREGTFEDAVYLWDNIENRSDFVNNNYSTYIGKEYSVSVLTNNKKKDGPKILLIRDSFSCVIQPFIGLDASEVIAVDFRRCKKSVEEIFEEYDPDIVVLAYNPSSFGKKQFSFAE